MALKVDVHVDARKLEMALQIDRGEHVAILGPNGSGKSTLLAVLAGLIRPDYGHVELSGRVLFDRADPGGSLATSTPTRWVAPHERNVSLLAQDPLLFPHLSVLDNVAFAPRSSGQSRKAARATALTWLTKVGAEAWAPRRVTQLSGGQAQRVAIARALAAAPRLMLLDEPMAALDVESAPLLRRVLREVLVGRSAIIVTHDLLDAMLLADRLIVIDQGRIVESGPVADVIAHPRTPFTAQMAGLNLVRGTAAESGLRTAAGILVRGQKTHPAAADEELIAVFSPRAVAVFNEEPHGSPRNTGPVLITAIEPRDEQVRVRAESPNGQRLVADITTTAVSELDLYPGKRVYFAVKATEIDIYPA